MAAFASEVAKHRIPPGHIDPATGLPAAAPPAGEGSSDPRRPPTLRGSRAYSKTSWPSSSSVSVSLPLAIA